MAGSELDTLSDSDPEYHKENLSVSKPTVRNKKARILVMEPINLAESNVGIKKFHLTAGSALAGDRTDSRSSFELRIPVAIASRQTPLGRLSKIENGQQMRLGSLNRNIEKVRLEVSEYSTRMMTVQTQRANYDLELYKEGNRISELKEKLKLVDSQIAEMKYHEIQSMNEIQHRFDEESKLASSEYEEKVLELTSKYTQEAEKQIFANAAKLKHEKKALEESCEELKSDIKLVEQDLNRKLIRVKESNSLKLVNLQDEISLNISEIDKDTKKIQMECEEKRKTLSLMSTNLEELENLHEQAQKDLENSLSKSKAKIDEMLELESQNNQLMLEILSTRDLFDSRIGEIDRLTAETEHLKDDWEDMESRRLILHNKLQDLKGNIRVFCRIRPAVVPGVNLNPNNTSEVCFQFHPHSFNRDAKVELSVSKEPISEGNTASHSLHGGTNSINTFQFDQVLSSSTKNAEIFVELSQLIQSSLDGFNVCIFAYGQTGSGKTWTMSHPIDGMVTLSVEKIFKEIEDLKQKHWNFQVKGQFLEIYNENVVDLLSKSSTVKPEIKHNENTTVVANAQIVNLQSVDQVMKILSTASRNRSTASTKSNERSSRSHSIYMFKIEGKNTKTGEKRAGTLNLVDLAGSERLAQSQATGDRLKETQAINKSLSSLGDVIHSLGLKKANHIPYRNSKLTYLLKNSLGGNSKVLMIVNVSPLTVNFGETINSLRFASKVNSTRT